MKIDKEKILSSAIYGLYQDQNYYGGLIQELTIKWDKTFPTAAIYYDKKNTDYNIILGEKFFLDLTPEQRTAVLKHEILHFTHGHLIRFPWTQDTPKEDKLKYNLAGDMAINQFIQNLPPGGVNVDEWKQDNGVPFPKFCSMEVYYDLINKNWEQNKHLLEQEGDCPVHGNGNGESNDGEGDGEEKTEKKGKGKQTRGNGKGEGQGNSRSDQNGNSESSDQHVHSSSGQKCTCKQHVLDQHEWEQLSEDEKKDMLKEAKKVFERSVEKTNYDYSAIPDYIQDMLKEIEVELKGIDYKRILRDTIKRTVCVSDRENTWNRRNKRYDVYAPGSKNGSLPFCFMAMDTSGSISHTEANEMLQTLSGFLKAGSRKCKLSLWHTGIYHTQNYKLNETLPEDVFQSGGTDVNPVLEYISKKKPDLAIIYTDGYYGEGFRGKITTDVIWIITKNGTKEHPYKRIGKTIQMV